VQQKVIKMRIKKKNTTKDKFLGLRISEKEQNAIKIKANLYTEGNVSEWILYASTNYRPKKEELE